jgi:hypothetical protein
MPGDAVSRFIFELLFKMEGADMLRNLAHRRLAALGVKVA